MKPTKTLREKNGADGCTYHLDYYEHADFPFRISKDEKETGQYTNLAQASKVFESIKKGETVKTK